MSFITELSLQAPRHYSFVTVSRVTCLRTVYDSFSPPLKRKASYHDDLRAFNLVEIPALEIYLFFCNCVCIFFTQIFIYYFFESISNTFFSFADFHHGFLQRLP